MSNQPESVITWTMGMLLIKVWIILSLNWIFLCSILTKEWVDNPPSREVVALEANTPCLVTTTKLNTTENKPDGRNNQRDSFQKCLETQYRFKLHNFGSSIDSLTALLLTPPLFLLIAALAIYWIIQGRQQRWSLREAWMYGQTTSLMW